MTMSVSEESGGATNNNNCTKSRNDVADLEHEHFVRASNGGLWPPPPPPPPHHQQWLPPDNNGLQDSPTYTPLVKVEPPAAASSTLGAPPPTVTANNGSNATAISTECSGCGEVITDRFILQVAGRSWHAHCLRCIVCHSLLDGHASCFLRDDQLYCKLDYTKLFGAKCFKCCRMISPADWVRKAKDQVYHLACFACDSCKRQLSTGEEFGINENRVLCKAHYMEIIDGGCTSSDESGDSESHTKKKTKRMRTTFTEEQVQILQANFQIDSNPDGQDLERIAQITGLSKRVTQVWFQNCRARQKKYINSGKRSASSGSGSKSIPITGLSPIPRDQCSGGSSQQQQLDLHAMYSSFRAAAAAAVNGGNSGNGPQPPPPPPPPQQSQTSVTSANESSNDGTDPPYMGDV